MCDLGYIIKDDLCPLLHVMTNRLKTYNMQLLTTKCLNTAVMMLHLLMSADESAVSEHTVHCDVPNVRARRRACSSRAQAAASSDCDTRTMAGQLRDHVMRLEPCNAGDAGSAGNTGNAGSQTGCAVGAAAANRTLVYIMITDGEMPLNQLAGGAHPLPRPGSRARGAGRGRVQRQAGGAGVAPQHVQQVQSQATQAEGDADAEAYFPGHVFVIEKLDGGQRYNMYQSYINHYDLKGNIQRNGGVLSIGRRRMQTLMDGLVQTISAPVWDAAASAFWNDFTHTPPQHTEGFEGHSTQNLLVCFRTVHTNNCTSKLHSIVQQTLDDIDRLEPDRLDQVYGDASLYSQAPQECQPMTNREVKASMARLAMRLR